MQYKRLSLEQEHKRQKKALKKRREQHRSVHSVKVKVFQPKLELAPQYVPPSPTTVSPAIQHGKQQKVKRGWLKRAVGTVARLFRRKV